MRSKDGKKKRNYKTEFIPDGRLFAARPSTKAPLHRSHDKSRTPPVSRHASGQSNASSRSRLSSGSIERKVTPSPKPKPASLEKIQDDTTLFIFTNFTSSDFDAAPGVVYLKSCRVMESLVSIIMPIVAGVEEHDIRQSTVRFDWLPESNANIIRMIHGLPDSYIR